MSEAGCKGIAGHRRRVRQLERCAQALRSQLFGVLVDINASGRDRPDNPVYRVVLRCHRRLVRVLENSIRRETL